MAAVNPFQTGATTTQAPPAPAPSPFAPTAAASNPFGAPAATSTAMPATSIPGSAPLATSTAFPATTAAPAGGTTTAAPAKQILPQGVAQAPVFGGFSWFQDLPRPLPAAPVAATAFGQPQQQTQPQTAPKAPPARPPPEIEKMYQRIRVAYSNRSLQDYLVARPAAAAGVAAVGFGAVQPQQQAAAAPPIGDGARLDPKFVKTVWVQASPKARAYWAPTLTELDPAGNPVLDQSQRPRQVQLLEPEEAQPTTTRPDGSRIVDTSRAAAYHAAYYSSSSSSSSSGGGATRFGRGPRFVKTVAVGFHGLKRYASKLRALASHCKEAATAHAAEVRAARVELERVSAEVERVDERQRRLSRRVLEAAQLAAELAGGAESVQLTASERDVIARVSAMRQRLVGQGHGLHSRTAAAQTQSALVTSSSSSSSSPLEDGRAGSVSAALRNQDALGCLVEALGEHQASIDKLKHQVRQAAADLRVIDTGLRGQ